MRTNNNHRRRIVLLLLIVVAVRFVWWIVFAGADRLCQGEGVIAFGRFFCDLAGKQSMNVNEGVKAAILECQINAAFAGHDLGPCEPSYNAAGRW